MTEMDGTAQRVAALSRIRGNARLLIACMRPKQWIKNSLILAPLIFSGHLFHVDSLTRAGAGVAIFSLLAGSLYIINDYLDMESDKLHPAKSGRPLASGRLSVAAALSFAVGTIAISLGAAFSLGGAFGMMAVVYAANVLSYSKWVKHVVILDVFSISFGFVLRAAAGAYVIHVRLSPWLVVCTICLSLFLGLTKRRAELGQLKSGASAHRRALHDYNLVMLDNMINVVTPSTLMCYALYTFTAGHGLGLMYTIPIVIFGLLRYLYLAERRECAGAPELALLTDLPLLTSVIVWGLGVVSIIYLL